MRLHTSIVTTAFAGVPAEVQVAADDRQAPAQEYRYFKYPLPER